jgi:peptide/nickel transport system permease protein
LRHVIAPALAMGLTSAGILMRITRSAVLEVTREDFVTVARAKGLKGRLVLRRHVLGNALIPIITVFGLELGTLMSGSIISETVFAWAGVGSLLIAAIQSRDYPLVTGLVLMYSVAFVLINLVVDVAYAVVDPRIRY